MRLATRAITFAATVACLGCTLEPLELPDGEHPRLLLHAWQKSVLLDRISREPYATILHTIEQRAAREPMVLSGESWDHHGIGTNNETAQAGALLGWLLGDQQAARKAVELMLAMPTDIETSTTWDVDIRMPHVLIPYCIAYDLLRATPWLSDAEAASMRAAVTELTGKFFEQYLDNPVTRQMVLGVSQNNHPIRTAAAVGMVAITVPDDPRAASWANWAFSELDYLLGPDGRYLQADGGVSEGPFYYGFALSAAMAFLLAVDSAVDPDLPLRRDCRNRQAYDPWLVTDCVQGEPFTFHNPLDSELLRASVDWSINLRLPSGWRAPLGDANFIVPPGGVLLGSFGAGGQVRWDWEHNPAPESPMTWGMDLTAQHLVYLDDDLQPSEPPWTNRFLPAAGNAVFRSGWDEQARWLLLVAEQGAARKTLHDHVDGTSFTMAAYGEYLLLDPGYYKPNDLDNALTADAPSHNVILIDGRGAPDKGLLLDFGDADASLDNTLDGTALAYAEAHQSYQQTRIERSAVFVRQRYFIIADRLSTEVSQARSHAWRLGGWAGHDVGGVFEPHACADPGACGVRFERPLAGVDVHLASTAPGLQVLEPPHTPLQPPQVEAFDEHRRVADHGVIDGVVEAVAPGFLAVLAPYRVGAAPAAEEGPLAVERLDAGPGAAAWLVRGAGGREIAWLRKPGANATLVLPAGPTWSSNAELMVADAEGSYALMARGTHLERDGTTLLSAPPGTAVTSTESQ